MSLLLQGGEPIMLRCFFAREEGQGLVEYALILSMIAIVVIGIVTILGNQVNENLYSNISSHMEEL
jgi:pilus assembly protein Flp/PilA